MMQFKKWALLTLVSMSILPLSACNKSAPELSFEETLEVYSKQYEKTLEFVNFMNHEGQLTSHLKMKADFSNEEVKGDLSLEAEGIAEKSSGESDTTITVALNGEGAPMKEGGFGKTSIHFLLKSLIKDQTLFLKLSDLSINSDEEQLKGMLNAVLDGLKDKWLSLNTPELTALLQSSRSQSLSFWQHPELYQAHPLFYTGVVSTKYEWNPAWKVDFNADKIQKFVLEMYDFAQNEAWNMGSGDEALLLAQQQMKEEMKQLLSQLKFENTEAYFVIRSADKVDFIVENSEILLENMKIQMKQLVKGKNTEIELLLTPLQSQESLKIKFTFSETGKGKWKWEFRAREQEEKAWKDIFTIKGTLKVRFSDKDLVLIPEFECHAWKTKANFSLDYQAKKTEGHTFLAPEDSQDLMEIFWALAGMMGTPVSDPTIVGGELQNVEGKLE